LCTSAGTNEPSWFKQSRSEREEEEKEEEEEEEEEEAEELFLGVPQGSVLGPLSSLSTLILSAHSFTWLFLPSLCR